MVHELPRSSGAQRTKTFDRKVDAERFLTTVESAKLTGSDADPAASRFTVGAWAEHWLDGQTHLKPSTRERNAGILREHIVPAGGRPGWPTSPSPHPRFLVDDLAAHVAGRDPSELVFAAVKGGAMQAQGFQRSVLTEAARSLGLAGLRPDALRHTAASLAIASGANVEVVQQLLGHKSATTTPDLHGHLFTDQLDEVANRLDAAARAVVYPMCTRAEVVPFATRWQKADSCVQQENRPGNPDGIRARATAL